MCEVDPPFKMNIVISSNYERHGPRILDILAFLDDDHVFLRELRFSRLSFSKVLHRINKQTGFNVNRVKVDFRNCICKENIS
jgi:hypothetical protein